MLPSRAVYKPRRPHTKSRTGCRMCRERKVKCDESRPTCRNCVKRGLGAGCKYPEAIVWVRGSTRTGPSRNTHTQTGTSLGPGSGASSSLTVGTIPPPSLAEHSTDARPAFSASISLPLGPPRTQQSSWDILAPEAGSSSLPTEGHRHNASSAALIFPTARATGNTGARDPGLSKFLSPSSQSFSSAGTCALDPISLSLIHLFTTHTAASLSVRKIHTLWSVNVPRQALRLARNNPETQSYLLYSLLSVAALHAATLSAQRNGRRAKKKVKKWVIIASSYHQLTLGGFQRAVDEYATSMNRKIREGGTEDIRPVRANHDSTSAGEQSLPKEEVDTLEAILMASSCLAIYAVAWTTSTLDIGSLGLEADSLRSGRDIPGSPIEATPLLCSGSSTLATSHTLLSWLPLIRGTPTMLRVFPIAWPILSQGHLAPFTQLSNNNTADYKHNITDLRSVISCHPHPTLPQPTYPLTRAAFDCAMDLLEDCYNKSFTTEDPVTVAMIFPSTVADEFILSVLGSHVKTSPGTGGLDNCRRDPRSLVVMGWFMVLLAFAEKSFPDVSEGKDIVVDFDDDDDDDDDDDGSLNVPGKLEKDSRGEFSKWEVSGSQAHSGSRVQTEADSKTPSPAWWFAGVAKREVEGITRYLRALDEEEWRVDGASISPGRWENWMKWPLDMVNKPRSDISVFNSPVSPSAGFGTSVK